MKKIEKRDALNALHVRRDYQAAYAIRSALSRLSPDNDTILSRLTVAEWEALRVKLTAVCLCVVVDGDNNACPVHTEATRTPPGINSSMAGLS